MSNYSKTVDFAVKDTLATGDPLKVVRGTEINSELSAIQTAIATKADTASPTFTGTPQAPTADGVNALQVANVAYVTAQVASGVPIGTIVMWSSTAGAYPAGWELCDGRTGLTRSDGLGTINVPDLRSRFIVGAGSTYAAGATGGSATHNHTESAAGDHNHTGFTAVHILTEAQMPVHSHAYRDRYYIENATGPGTFKETVPGGNYNNNRGSGASDNDNNTFYYYDTTTSNAGSGSGHSHGVSTDGSHTHVINSSSNLPPYFALAFLMKV